MLLGALEKTALRAAAKASVAADEAKLAVANAKSFSPFKKKKLSAQQKAQRMAAMMNAGKRKKLSDAATPAERKAIAATIINGAAKRALMRMHMYGGDGEADE